MKIHPGTAIPRFDGNALAGMLSDLFVGDPTVMSGECSGCGVRAPLAEAVVEMTDHSAIALCRTCTHTLFTVIRTPSGVDLEIGAVRLLHLG